MSAKINSPPAQSASCPWAQKQFTPPVSSFSEVMDEEYAQQLQNEFPSQTDTNIKIQDELKAKDQSDETMNDLLLAQMLQLEFDRENDVYVKSLEKSHNGNSKVSMSFQNFRNIHPYNSEQYDDDTDEERYDENDDEKESCQERRHDGIITKHDSFISERKNAKNVEMFQLGFASGDVGKKDIRLPNHVYNKLKVHAKKEERHEMRIHEKKEHSTYEKALDENTRLVLYKMVNNGTLENINGIVSTGKEAVVVHCNGGELDEKALPRECVLKIFKTTLNEFKTREKYIKDDHRFRDRFAKQNPRKIIRLWAEKEFRNLNRMKEAGINCPCVLGLKKHILIMSFIGINQIPARKLKEVVLSQEQYLKAYETCIETMKTMYEKCNLIHADLSEYNILWHNSQCFFIDVSQSVEPVHPHAYHFLLRDCRNIIRFFTKVGLTTVMKEEELFSYVCGKQLDITSLDAIEKECSTQFEKDLELLTFGQPSKNYEFEYHFQNTQTDENADDA